MKKIILFLITLFVGLNIIQAQTRILRKVDTLSSSKGVFSYGEFLGELNGTLFYVGRTEDSKRAIRTVTENSTPTIILSNIAELDEITDFVVQQGKAYFIHTSSNTNSKLYASDGTLLGTTLIRTNRAIKRLRKWKSNLVFAEQTFTNYYLSYLNTSNNNIQQLESSFFEEDGGIRDIAVKDTTIYLICRDSDGKPSLSSMNGIKGNLVKIKDLPNTFVSGGNNNYLTLSDNRLYFFSNSFTNSFWTSDGTELGTIKLKDDFTLDNDVKNRQIGMGYNNKFYFRAKTFAEGIELWETDGTVANTKIAKDFSFGNSDGNPSSFLIYKNELHFIANGGFYNNLWKVSNVGNISQVSLIDINGIGSYLTAYKDSLLFSGDIKSVGNEMLLFGGNGYKILTNGNNGKSGSFTIFRQYGLGNTIFFSAAKNSEGTELWAFGPKPSAPLAATITQEGTIKCNGDKIDLKATATGGTLPYKYLWSNGATTESITSIGAGVYSATVTSNDKQSIIASITVTEPTKIVVTTTTKAANPQFKNGNAVAAATGGAAPYTYAWNTNPIQTTATAIGLLPGNYMVTVTDSNGCKTTVTTTVGTSTSTNSVWEKYSFTAFPNPVTDILTISFNGLAVQKVDVLLIDATGKIVLTQTFDNNRFSLNVAELPQGIYTLKCHIGQEEANTTILIQR